MQKQLICDGKPLISLAKQFVFNKTHENSSLVAGRQEIRNPEPQISEFPVFLCSGNQENKKSRKQESRGPDFLFSWNSGKQDIRKTGNQEIRKTGNQENGQSGNHESGGPDFLISSFPVPVAPAAPVAPVQNSLGNLLGILMNYLNIGEGSTKES